VVDFRAEKEFLQPADRHCERLASAASELEEIPPNALDSQRTLDTSQNRHPGLPAETRIAVSAPRNDKTQSHSTQ
jgi:hypothetical protein